jgi:uncharacterized coiled-coil protein SlyX
MSINSHSNVSQRELEKEKFQKTIKLHPELEKLICGHNNSEKLIDEINETVNMMADEIDDLKRKHDALYQTVLKYSVAQEIFDKFVDEHYESNKRMCEQLDRVNVKFDEIETVCCDLQDAHRSLDDDYKQLKNALTSTVTKQVNVETKKILIRKKEQPK